MNAKTKSFDIFLSWRITSDGDFISENGCNFFFLEYGVEEGSQRQKHQWQSRWEMMKTWIISNEEEAEAGFFKCSFI